jgi:hypothetical protein
MLTGLKNRNRRSPVAFYTACFFVAGLLFSPNLAQACTTSWTGTAGDGLWTTAGNWSTDMVPTATDDVCLDASSSATLAMVNTGVHSLTNAGTLTLSATLSLANGTTSSNSGLIDFKNGGGLNGGGATLQNTGTLRGSGGTAGIAPFVGNTTGTVLVQSGVLSLSQGLSSSVFNVGTGAELDLGTFTIADGASLIGAGTIGFNGFGTLTFAVDFTIEVAKFAFANGTVIGDASVTFANTLNWSGGIMYATGAINFANTATVNIIGSAQLGSLAQTTPPQMVNNAGNVVMSGAGVLTLVLTVFNNQAAATFDFQNNGGINEANGASTFNNAGTVKKSAGNGTAQIVPTLVNTGSILAQSNKLGLTKGSSSGIFNAGLGAELDLGVFTINSGASLAGLGTIGFNGFGTLTFAADTTISVAFFIFANGTMNGAGNVTFNNTLNWSGGTMNGIGTINFASTATVNILGNVVEAQTVNNAGLVAMRGNFQLALNNGAVFNNEASGTFDLQADGGMTGGGASAFNNVGTLKKSGGTGNSSLGPFPVNNSGSIAAQSGTLTLSGGGASGGVLSSFSAGNGATLAFSSGTFTMNVGAALSGGGTIAINGATVTFTVDIAIDTTTIAFSGGTVNGVGGVTFRHILNWSGGTMSGAATSTISDTGTVNISGSVTLDTRTLTTTLSATGTITTPGCIALRNNATINNTGSFDIQDDCGPSGTGTWNNSGSLKKSGGTGLSSFGFTFNNSGTVLVQSGTIGFSAGGSNSGTMTPAMATTLAFSGGTFTVTSGIPFTGAGTLSLSGATLTFAADTSISTAVFTFTSGIMNGVGHATFNDTVNWSGGTMSGVGSTNIAANGTLNIQAPTILDTRTINSIGSIVMSGTGRLTVSDGAIINNQMSGVFDIQIDSGIFAGAGAPGALNNAGTFKKSAGAGTSPIGVAFANASLVQVLSGTLSFQSTYTQSAGSTVLNGGALSVAGPNSIDIEGGTLSGSGTIAGKVVNNATVKPGASPGMISITGNYVQGPSGVLNMEIVGPTPGTGYSQLNISGTATLNGTLNIALGFTPFFGETFVILTYASETGSFAAMNGLNQGGITFQANLNPNNLTLVNITPKRRHGQITSN